MSVSYVTAPKDVERPGLAPVQLPRTPTDAFVYRVDRAAPRAFVAGAVVHKATKAQVLDHLRTSPDAVSEVAVVEPSSHTLPDSTGSFVHLTRYLPARVELRAELTAPGLVVLTDTFFPGWRAFVDRTPTPIVRANYFARGVFVDAGEHQIVFQYAPSSFRVGAAVTILTLTGLLVAFVLDARRTRVVHKPASGTGC